MFCKSCGKEISDEAVICPSCGVSTGTTGNKTVANQNSVFYKWGTGTFIMQAIATCLIPLIGFVIGIIAMVKGRIGYGLGLVIISIIAFIAYLSVM